MAVKVIRDLGHVRQNDTNDYQRKRSWYWVCDVCYSASSSLTTHARASDGAYRHEQTKMHVRNNPPVPTSEAGGQQDALGTG